MITAEIKKMPTRDRMVLMEELWDTLRCDQHDIESPAWHADVLAERRAKLERGDARLITVDDLKADA